MKTMLLLVTTAFAAAESKDVWYDSAGQPVKTTVAEAAPKVQPRDLIAGKQPLQRVEPFEFRRSARDRRWIGWQPDFWGPWGWWGGWNSPRFPHCPQPLPIRRTRGQWCFSYQSQGISVNLCR